MNLLQSVSGLTIDWQIVILAIITAVQVLGLALIARGRKADKSERAQVAVKVVETATIAAQTAEVANKTLVVAEKTHEATNSRYSALENELRSANERIIDLLQEGTRQRSTDTPQPSAILATEVPDDVGTAEGAPLPPESERGDDLTRGRPKL